MHPFRSLYGPGYDFPHRGAPPEKTYFLAAIPRVGSTFLGLELWKTGILGAPLEYLNLTDREDTVTRYTEGDLEPYWRDIKSRRTSPNGVFGSKLFTKDIRDVFNRDPLALSIIKADYVVLLRRRDIVQQALSHSRARQTQIWISGGKSENAANANYDFDDISRSIRAIKRQQDSWDKILNLTGANCMTVYYEDFDLNPVPTVARVIHFLGITDTQKPMTNLPILSRQRDALSTEWRDRYLAGLTTRGISLDDIK